MRWLMTSFTPPNFISSIRIELSWSICSADNRNLAGLFFYRKRTYGYKKLCFHGNSLFSSPHPPDFNMLVIFSSRNIKRGHKLELTNLHAYWIKHMRHHLQISKWNAKGGQKCLNIGEVWNPVYFHGNQIVKLILWSTLSTISLQRITHFWILIQIGWDSLFHNIWSKFGSVWRHDWANMPLNISGTKIDIWI